MSESMNFDKLHKEYKKTQKYVCQNPGCGQTFGIRTRPDRDSSKFCSPQCVYEFNVYKSYTQKEEYNKNPNKCKCCNADILYKEGYRINDIKRKKFCNKSCAGKFNNLGRKKTVETKKKLSEKAKSNPNGCLAPNYIRKERKKIYKICSNLNCGIFFQLKANRKKYCSTQCHKKNSGGFKKGSSRGKTGYYKNIWCDSTYELAYVIYCLDHNISIERNMDFWEYNFEDKTRKYYPDFIINKGLDNESLVEIKGLSRNVDLIKIQAVDKPIIYLDKLKLKHIFEYVENKTNIKITRLYSLYENYIPEERKCKRLECNNIFSIFKTNEKKKFCSISCAKIGRNKRDN